MTPTSLRTWRIPSRIRLLVGSALLLAALGLAAAGHSMLSGMASLTVLVVSATCLAGLTAFLWWAFAGQVFVNDAQVLLPDGDDVPRRRLTSAQIEDAPDGQGVLVLNLVLPDEVRRIPTGQSRAHVAAFAASISRVG